MQEPVDLLAPRAGVMIWTLVIYIPIMVAVIAVPVYFGLLPAGGRRKLLARVPTLSRREDAMPTIARWLRGALGVGLTWAVLWLGVGVLLWGGFLLFAPEDVGPDEGASVVLPILALVGFLSGLGFATLISFTERRHRLSDLSLWRVAVWGALGSAAIPTLLGADRSEGWLTAILGALFASASVAVARRGHATDRSLDGPDTRGISAPDSLRDPLATPDRTAARPAT